MTNLESIFKSRDITLPTKVHLAKAMVFPVVMYGYESWTVKKAECRRIDAFELWCWRRLLRVPWTARRSNQCTGFSLQWFLLLQSIGSRHVGFRSCSTQVGSVVVVHRLSCSTACGIFLDQGLNLCLLFWQVDSHPLCHQGSPVIWF